MGRRRLGVWCLVLAGALMGCDSSTVAEDASDAGADLTADAAFAFDLTHASTIDVVAHGPTGTLSGVLISIRNAPLPGNETGDLLWTGVTGADGHARGATRTELVSGMVYVTIHKMGWDGPWTDDALRVHQGVLAPSGYLAMPPAMLDGLDVALTPRSS